MEEYIKRMKAEKSELEARANKINKIFIDNNVVNKVFSYSIHVYPKKSGVIYIEPIAQTFVDTVVLLKGSDAVKIHHNL